MSKAYDVLFVTISHTQSLQPGKHADIIAVDGNPLQELRALQNILAVMKKGRMAHLASNDSRKAEDFAYEK